MAGGFEEPFSFNFQAESLHSGSISFGRFENEPLSWERRSSFSHNRYLEEVEKFSKPGSVTEKKAYFEAHFKKKALLRQGSSEGHLETEDQASEHNISNNMSHKEEFELVNECSNVAHFDDSPDGSDYYAEHEGTGSEREDIETSYCEQRIETVYNNADIIVENYLLLEKPMEVEQTFTICNYSQSDTAELTPAKPAETHQTVIECDYSQSDSAELEADANDNLNDGTENAGEESTATDLCPISQRDEKTININVISQPNHSPKLRASKETMPTKPLPNSHVNVTQASRSSSNKAVSGFSKSVTRKETQNLMQTKTAKSHMTLKSEHYANSKAKIAYEDKSDHKDLKEKKVIGSQASALKKDESRAHQTLKRSMVNSSKLGTKSSPTVFSFRSQERAERRKEFHMRIEEKMHAKETEINQIQAKTQEKTEAEIKQFRRTLNFKATPMPSFYHEAAKPASDKYKSAKSSKLQSKASRPGTGASTKSSSHLKAGTRPIHCGSVSKPTIDGSQVTETSNFPETDNPESCENSPVSSSRKGHSAQINIKIEGPEMEVQQKEKDMNLQKYRVSEDIKLTKSQSNGGRSTQKIVNESSSKWTARKDMKAGKTVYGSGMRHLVIGVSS